MIPQSENLFNRFHYGEMSRDELVDLVQNLIRDRKTYNEFVFYQNLQDVILKSKDNSTE